MIWERVALVVFLLGCVGGVAFIYLGLTYAP